MRLLLLLAAILGAACGAPRAAPERDRAAPSPTASPTASPAAAASAATDPWAVAGRSVEGRLLRYAVRGDGPLTVYLVASIHGDEAAATPLVERAERHLASRPALLAGRRVVLVPELNPDGVAARRRTNANGVDLNRNFPATNHQPSQRMGAAPLSEPESRALAALFERWPPDRVLSFHQPADLLDYDGPAGALADELAAAGPLAVRRLGARPGSLGSWTGVDRGVPTLTVELPRSASALDPDALWERYGALCLAAIASEDERPRPAR